MRHRVRGKERAYISYSFFLYIFCQKSDSNEGNKGIKVSKINDQNLAIATGETGSDGFIFWSIQVKLKLKKCFLLYANIILSSVSACQIYSHRPFSQFYKHSFYVHRQYRLLKVLTIIKDAFLWQGKFFLVTTLFVLSTWSKLCVNVYYQLCLHQFHK